VPVLAIGREVDGIARLGQDIRQLAAQVGVVFNNKDTHGNYLPYNGLTRITRRAEL
jgi:hypothetical protein